jgi:hypothetical protein
MTFKISRKLAPDIRNVLVIFLAWSATSLAKNSTVVQDTSVDATEWILSVIAYRFTSLIVISAVAYASYLSMTYVQCGKGAKGFQGVMRLVLLTKLSKELWKTIPANLCLATAASLLLFDGVGSYAFMSLVLISKFSAILMLNVTGGETGIKGIFNRSKRAKEGSDLNVSSLMSTLADLVAIVILSFSKGCKDKCSESVLIMECQSSMYFCSLDPNSFIHVGILFFVALVIFYYFEGDSAINRSVAIVSASGIGIHMTETFTLSDPDTMSLGRTIGYQNMNSGVLRGKLMNGEFSPYEAGLFYAIAIRALTAHSKKGAKDMKDELLNCTGRITGLSGKSTSDFNSASGTIAELAIYDFLINKRVSPGLTYFNWKPEVREALFILVALKYFKGKRDPTIEGAIKKATIKEAVPLMASEINTELPDALESQLASSTNVCLGDNFFRKFNDHPVDTSIDTIMSKSGIKKFDASLGALNKYCFVQGPYRDLGHCYKVESGIIVDVQQGTDPVARSFNDNQGLTIDAIIAADRTMASYFMPGTALLSDVIDNVRTVETPAMAVADMSTLMPEGAYFSVPLTCIQTSIDGMSGNLIDWTKGESPAGKKVSEIVDMTRILNSSGIRLSG